MSGTTSKRLVIRSLFYRTLSGEFVVDSGRWFHCHTLGKLATSALQIGDSIPSLENEKSTEFYYRPPWAPKILAKAIYDEGASSQSPLELSELALIADSKELVFINTELSNPELPGAAMVSDAQHRTVYNIDSNTGLLLARRDFAAATQAFIRELDDSRANQ